MIVFILICFQNCILQILYLTITHCYIRWMLSDALPEESSKLDTPEILPSYEFLYEDPSQKCNPISKQFACSAVIPSLPTTIKWLRDCVKENPSFRVQVNHMCELICTIFCCSNTTIVTIFCI